MIVRVCVPETANTRQPAAGGEESWLLAVSLGLPVFGTVVNAE